MTGTSPASTREIEVKRTDACADERIVPRATYRLQFNHGFTLRNAIDLVPYLSALGISHVYASPLLKATAGSMHGYDVCDFHQLNPEIGTEADLKAFVTELRAHEMGLVLDIVPGHMGVAGCENRWWQDVLTFGRASRYADYFDINWNSPDPRLRGKVLVPVLGDRYQRLLENGLLQIRFENGKFTLCYEDHEFPLTPTSVAGILRRASETYRSDALLELARASSWPDSVLEHLCRETPAIAKAISQAANEVNASPDALDALMQEQHYRLTFWRNGDNEVNYRRFFNITTLASLRMELPQVFEDTHRLLIEWHKRGWVDGFRVDHIDGLRDPEDYLNRLREAAPGAWIVVEKILEPGERLPETWPVAGTTGYDFIARAGGLFIDPAGERPLTDFYSTFASEPTNFAAMVLSKNRLVLRDLLSAEITRLVNLLLEIAARRWRVRDFSPDELRSALIELVACLPVYRTYVRPHVNEITEADSELITQTIATAQRQRPDLDSGLFAFLGDLLLLQLRGDLETEFISRLQQVTGPAMAKGVEDTALYCFNRLIALNEVGCDPGRFGVSIEEFHRTTADSQLNWPDSMLGTSTHDTKLSEDVRARISLLSEIPDQWSAAVRRWSALNNRFRQNNLPGRNIEYRFYQTLIGAWPIEIDRVLTHFDKVACEAKTRTTWTRRNEPYDEALRGFVIGALSNTEFMVDFEQFVKPLIEAGRVNSLAQTLLKLTCPGVPDIYQGEEIWNFNLVDPDNRRPVDFAARKKLFAETPSAVSAGLEFIQREANRGAAKLWLIRQALALRRLHPEWFDADSRYESLSASGKRANHVVAFVRGDRVITIVPRLTMNLKGDWADTVVNLPHSGWRSELTGELVDEKKLRLADVFQKFPVALLSRGEEA
jgi:(1->4)-alpha-D-glucan 1-alpha-D-glucosylmutase